jgi:hypothetical protein
MCPNTRKGSRRPAFVSYAPDCLANGAPSIVARVLELPSQRLAGIFVDAAQRFVDAVPPAFNDEVRIEQSLDRNAGVLAELPPITWCNVISSVSVFPMDAPIEVLRVAAPALGFGPEVLEAFEYDAPFLRSWTFWLVSDGCLPPGDVYVAERKGAAVLVTLEDGFGPFVQEEAVTLDNADAAIAYVRMFIRTTRPGLQVRESLEEIPGLIPEVAAELTVAVLPPKASATKDGGWEVVAFLNELDELDVGRFSIAPGGQLTVSLERVAEGISIFSAWE